MSSIIKKILVLISFATESSKEHFAYAAHLANDIGAELIGLSVLRQGDVDSAAVYSRLVGDETINVTDLANREIERRKKRVEVVLNELGLADIQRTVEIRVGDPFEEILKAIDEFGVDLVVMGASGLISKDARFDILRGSISEKVFSHSPVSVLSIRIAEVK